MMTLLSELIACQSITPNDAGCQKIIANALSQLGFQIQSLPFGPVTNLWAQLGTSGPLFVFAGHSDVVPPGPLEKWHSPPFTASSREGYLFGRGTADMKGAIVCMLEAYREVLKHGPFPGSLGFIITSDEEGPENVDGTKKVIEHLTALGKKIDYCLVGEASSLHKVGDSIKIGRRGSLTGKLRIHGKQGHVAYPDRAKNPIHEALPFLHHLSQLRWDEGNTHFPPTSFQVTTLHSGNGTANVIPGELDVIFNFRFSPELSVDAIKQKVNDSLASYALNAEIEWQHSASPFITQPCDFTDLVAQAIHHVQGFQPELATDGGTSDARFIAPTGAKTIELGVCRDTIHQVNECVKLDDLIQLKNIYIQILLMLKEKHGG